MNILWEDPKIWLFREFSLFYILVTFLYLCFYSVVLIGSLSLQGWEALGNTETDLPDKNEFYVSFFRLLSVPIKENN